MKKMISVAGLLCLCIISSSAWGQERISFFNGKEVIRKERVELKKTENVLIQSQAYVELSFHQTIGWTFFAVPTAGMELVFTEGFGTLVHFQYSNGAYAWVLYDSNVLSSGIFGLYKNNPYLENEFDSVSFLLKGTIDNPAHYLFLFAELKKSEFLQLGIIDQNLLPQDPAAIYNYAYVADLTAISLSRICDIDNTISQELDGSLRLIKVLALVLPRDEEAGYLSEVMLIDQAKASKRVLRSGQLFGLVLQKTPFSFPE